jgi:toxin-antitoxin system PIN domain toxin
VISLLDVNVLVALSWPSHEHHELARVWFDRHHQEGWATCPLTQSGFVRVSSNRHVLPYAKTPREAISLLKQIVTLPSHVFLPDEISLAASRFVAAERLQGHRQVTDAHLLGIALGHGARLATLDRSVVGLIPPAFETSRPVWLLTEAVGN